MGQRIGGFFQLADVLFRKLQVSQDKCCHLFAGGTRVVAGILLGGVFVDNGHRQSFHVGSTCSVVGQELEHAGHIQIEHGAEGMGGSQVTHLRLGSRFLVQRADQLVGGQHGLPVVVPDELRINIALCLVQVLFPALVPVVA